MRTSHFLIGLGTLSALTACGNNPDGANSADDPHGRISGMVVDVGQDALAGVEVTAQGQMVLTDEAGHYTLEMVDPGQEILIKFQKNGYSENARYANIVSWETASANATLKAHDWVQTFNPAFGGDMEQDGMRVSVPGGAMLLDGQVYTGDVEVSVTYFDPYSDELAAAPGDLTALRKSTDSSGAGKNVLEQAQLLSFGMVEVIFRADDREQLMLGEPIEVEIPISQTGVPDYYQVSDGQEILLWDWSDDAGAWLEEGTGRVTSDESGNSTYTFSTSSPGGKNPDSPIEYTCVQGKVVDTIDFPVRSAQVECRGQLTSSTVTADENGNFECTVAVGDTVYIVPNTYVADQTWYGFDSLVATSKECDDVGDVTIEVCRESGVMMADNVKAYSDTGSWDADNLRAWFWEPKGYVEYCNNPWDDIPLDDCQLLNIDLASTWFPDMDPETGIMKETKSVGSRLTVETGRDVYALESQLTDSGVPVYHHERHDGQGGNYDDDGQLSIDGSNNVDLRGGDVLVTSAPGNASDYMGAWSNEEWIRLPSEMSLGTSAASIQIRRGQTLTLNYNGADNNEDDVLVFALTDDKDTAMVCRAADDGTITISGAYTSQFAADEDGTISFYKADVGWEAGPDGLPIRMQGLTGATLSLDIQ